MLSEFTLVDLCIAKVALLLKECYWPIGSYRPQSSENYNPFSCLPSYIVEELMAAVIQLTPSGMLSVKHLYLILSSGRVKHFKLEDVLLSTEEFAGILTSLSVHGMHLNKLTLRKVYCLETPDERLKSMNSAAIELLLSMSPNLEYIEIDKCFDLKAIQRVRCLKHLELNFVPQNQLYDLLPKLSGWGFIPNETITFISIYEDYHNQIPVEEIAFLLEYCLELTCIENSIASALELLHGEQLFCGSVTRKYKLQKYTLGSVFVSSSEGIPTVPILHIATLTCPDTRDLNILINEHQAISVISDFGLLESVLIQWEKVTAGDFRLALQSVLERIGPQLKDLSILNFTNVDFEAIGRSCPSLQEFKVEYDIEVNASSTDCTYFKRLTGLHVQCETLAGIKSETLLLLLGGCKQLTSLCLDNIRFLNDELLVLLLRGNPLAQLKEASLTYCSLTEYGLQCLVKSCPLMEFLCFYSSLLPFDDAVETVHNINPFIIVSVKA